MIWLATQLLKFESFRRALNDLGWFEDAPVAYGGPPSSDPPPPGGGGPGEPGDGP